MEEETDKEEKEKVVREIGGKSLKNGMERACVREFQKERGQQSSQWYEGKIGKKDAKIWSILFQSSLWEPE